MVHTIFNNNSFAAIPALPATLRCRNTRSKKIHVNDVLAIIHHHYINDKIVNSTRLTDAITKEDGNAIIQGITETDRAVALDIIEYFSLEIGQRIIEGKGTKFDALVASVLANDDLITADDISRDRNVILKLPEIYYDRKHKEKWFAKIKDLDSKQEEVRWVNEVITVGFCTQVSQGNSGGSPGLLFKYINENNNIIYCYTDKVGFGKSITNFVRQGAVIRVHGKYFPSLEYPNETRLQLEHIGPETVNIF